MCLIAFCVGLLEFLLGQALDDLVESLEVSVLSLHVLLVHGQDKIQIKWHGMPVSARLKRDGNKKMHITFDADRFLSLLTLAGNFSDNSAIKTLSKLMENYEDVMVGFELKK